MKLSFSRFLQWRFLLLACLFGCHPKKQVPLQTTPCMTDRECIGSRICHQGACNFASEISIAQESELWPSENFPGWVWMGGPSRNGRSPNKGPISKPEIVWSYATQNRIVSTPALGPDKSVLVGSLDGSLSALRPEGSLKWRVLRQGPFYSSAAITKKGFIFLNETHLENNANSLLLAFKPSGDLHFKMELPGRLESSPALDAQGNVIVSGKAVYCISQKGHLLWQQKLPSYAQGSPAISSKGSIVVATTQGQVLSFSPAGNPEWNFSLSASVSASPAITEDGTVLIGTESGELFAISPKGKIQWRYKTKGPILATPAIAKDGTIVVGSYDHSIYGISKAGKPVFKYETGGRVRSSACIDANQNIFVGSQDNALYALTLEGSLLWKRDMSADIDSTPVISPQGMILIGADNGKLYALEAKTQQSKTLPSNPKENTNSSESKNTSAFKISTTNRHYGKTHP